MKYSQASILLVPLVLFTAVRASKVAEEQRSRSTKASTSSFLDYFGFGKKASVVPASAVSVESKSDPDEPWVEVDVVDMGKKEKEIVFKKERVTKEEIEAHNQEMKKQALERRERKRLARVRRAEEDEALLRAVMPHGPKMSAGWYQGAAPVVLQEEEAIMMIDSEDEQPSHGFMKYNAEEAVLVDDEIMAEDQQPQMDDQVPMAPPMDAIVASMRAPVQESTEDVQKPKEPNVFRGKTVQQIGLAKSDESAASVDEVTLIQQFKAEFNGADTYAERRSVINNMQQALTKNPKFTELHKLRAQLLLQVNYEAVKDESDEESEESEFF